MRSPLVWSLINENHLEWYHNNLFNLNNFYLIYLYINNSNSNNKNNNNNNNNKKIIILLKSNTIPYNNLIKT